MRGANTILSAAILALSSRAAVSHVTVPPKTPHVVILLVDDWGSNDLGKTQVEQFAKTPNLDRFWNEGVNMSNSYVQYICSPTRSQLISGRYQIHTGLQHGVIRPNQPNALPKNETTIAQAFKRQGYATQMVGKWHVGFYQPQYWPNERGFDSYYGMVIGASDHYTHSRSWDGGAGYANTRDFSPDFSANGTYTAELFSGKAAEAIRSHAKEHGNDGTPLFLYLATQCVHAPLQADQKYLDRFEFLAKDAKGKARQKYLAMLEQLDDNLATVMQALDETGMAKDTVVAVMQDNGGQASEAGGNNWPRRGEKGTLFEGGIVTNAAFWSGGDAIPASRRGQSFDGMFHVTDLFPTLAGGVAGADLSDLPLDGHNQWEAVTGKNTTHARTELLINIDPVDGTAGIIQDGWKLLMGPVGNNDWFVPPGWTPPAGQVPPPPGPKPGPDTIQLFHLPTDPNEWHDVSGQNPEIVQRLKQRIQEYNSTAVPCRYPAMDPKGDPQHHGGVWTFWQNNTETILP